jgi:hypothetical protein
MKLCDCCIHKRENAPCKRDKKAMWSPRGCSEFQATLWAIGLTEELLDIYEQGYDKGNAR